MTNITFKSWAYSGIYYHKYFQDLKVIGNSVVHASWICSSICPY